MMFRSLRPALTPLSRGFHSTRPALSLTNLFEVSDNPPLSITKLTPRGFQFSDGLLVNGGCVLADGRALLWDVEPPKAFGGAVGMAESWAGWSEDQFKVFEMLVPRPEILIFGTGERVLPAPKAIRDYISGLGIQLDVMDSRNAASTYNLLFEEGRTISAALCPLKPSDHHGTSR